MKFLKVARLDDSDDHVYAKSARDGELAITGSFVFSFAEQDPETLAGKEALAFRNGLIGLESFGWSTLVRVDEVSEAEYEAAIDRLAHHFVESFGAPSLAEALPVARQEAEYAASLCEHPVGTLIAVERYADEEGIHEAFKHIQQKAPSQPQVADWQGNSGEVRIWDMFPDHNKA